MSAPIDPRFADLEPLLERLRAPLPRRWWLLGPALALFGVSLVAAFVDTGWAVGLWPWPSVGIFASIFPIRWWMTLTSRDQVRHFEAQRDLLTAIGERLGSLRKESRP